MFTKRYAPMQMPCRSWTVLGVLCLALAGWAAAVDTAPKDLDTQIRELTPSHPAPATGALLPLGEEAGPMRLLGVDLLQSGAPLAGDCPKLDGNIPLDIVVYWCPAATIAGRVPTVVRFWSQDYMIGRDEDLVSGPAAGEPAWEPGGVYKQKHSISLPQIAGAINGSVHLSIHLSAGTNAGAESPALQQLDMAITPRVGSGRIARTLLESKLEHDAEPLSKSFRLGRGASVTIPVGIHHRALRGIIVVSSFAYGTVAQGKPVVEVGVNEGGATRSLQLLSGVHTARGDYDFNLPGTMNHAKPAIVESQDADYLDASGAPFRRHRYMGALPLDPPAQNLELLTFHAVADVVVDVFDVALLYAEPAAPAPAFVPAPAAAAPATPEVAPAAPAVEVAPAVVSSAPAPAPAPAPVAPPAPTPEPVATPPATPAVSAEPVPAVPAIPVSAPAPPVTEPAAPAAPVAPAPEAVPGTATP